MNKQSLAKTVHTVKRTLSKHSPEILTSLGIAGMITTTVLAVRATPKALKLREVAEEEKGEELTPIETVKVAWKPYIPAVTTGAVSIACLVGANSVNARRNAALATAYKLSEAAYAEYRDKVVETVGEKKERTVREKVANEQIKKHPVTQSEIVSTGKGKTLCFDPYSGRYFTNDIETIRRAANNLNEQMLNSITGYMSLSDFYDEIGLAHTEISHDIGWNTSNIIKLDISAHVTDDGQSAIVVGYINPPRYNYY